MNKNKLIKIALLSMFVMGINASESFALPNQTEAVFLKWCSTNPVLKGTKRFSYEQADFTPAFAKEFVLTGSKVSFWAWTGNTKPAKIVQEAIVVEDNFSDKKMVTLIEKIYGKAFLNDFMSSKILLNGKVESQTDGLTNFLVVKGAKFGAVVEKYDADTKYFRVLIMSPAETQSTYNQIKSGNYFVD